MGAGAGAGLQVTLGVGFAAGAGAGLELGLLLAAGNLPRNAHVGDSFNKELVLITWDIPGWFFDVA